MSEPKPPFLRRVVLRNYKSIRHCDVSLGPLTFLVGPNGSGKSNFLDALRFVSDSLRSTSGLAISERRGFDEVCHRLSEAEDFFAIELRLTLRQGREAHFRFVVGKQGPSAFEIREEACSIKSGNVQEANYCIRNGQMESASFHPTPPVATDRLYLVVASAFPEFRSVYDVLAAMRFYNIDPAAIRAEANMSSASSLERNGRGAIMALRHLAMRSSASKERMTEYMRAILPCLKQIRIESFDEWTQRISWRAASPSPELRSSLWLWFVQKTAEEEADFAHFSMSDGTLRAFGVLLALFQCVDRPEKDPIPLVGIEEPEAALHPAAAGVLFDALHEASHFTQVLVTTHSADLLDVKDLDVDSLLIVDMADGQTVVGSADEVSKSIMRDRLATAGELLRQKQLSPKSQSPGPVNAETD